MLALVLSCVAIVIAIINKSDEDNRVEIKRLDEMEKRFEAIEQEPKTKGKGKDEKDLKYLKSMSLDVFKVRTTIMAN